MRDKRRTQTASGRKAKSLRRTSSLAVASQECGTVPAFIETLIDTIPSGIFYKDSRGVYRGCNKAFASFLGLTKEDIVGKTLQQVFPPDLADKYQKMDLDLFVNPGKQEYEWQIVSADGTRRDVVFSKATFQEPDGNLGGLVGVMTDITARRQAETQLRDREEMFRMMAGTAQDAIILMDNEGRIIFWNAAAEKLFGYKEEEALSQNLHLLLAPPRYYKAYKKGYSVFRKTGRGDAVGKTLELAAVGKDGVEFPIELSVSATRIGGKWHAVGIVRDISERKRILEALRASEERYRNIFENAVVGIFQSSPDGRIINVNPTHAHMFGYDSPQEMIDAFEDIGQGHYVNPQDRRRFKEICDEQGYIRGFEVEFYNKQGTKIWVSLNARTVRDSAGDVLYYEGIAEDITKRVQAEKELKESRRFLSQVIDFLPDPTFAVDCAGQVLVWNKAMEEMTGINASEMVGKGDYEYALPFYGFRRPMLADLLFRPDEIREGDYEVLKKGEDMLLAESDRTVGGSLRTIWGKAAFLYDSEGRVLGAIESIRDITRRREAEDALKKREQELLIKSRSLEEINVALKVLLDQRVNDKNELEDSIMSNMQKRVAPYLARLKASALAPREAAYLRILEDSLHEIVSPFANKLGSRLSTLTARECEIAKLIRDGNSTKEIAAMLHATSRAVEFHRDNIRKKLGLNKSSQNLRTYLLTLV